MKNRYSKMKSKQQKEVNSLCGRIHGARPVFCMMAALIAAALLTAACVSNPGALDSDAGPTPLTRDATEAGAAQTGTEAQAEESKYANMNNWIRFEANGTKDVDIFMIYPSVVTGISSAEDRPYIRIDNSSMRSSSTSWVNGLSGGSSNRYPGMVTSHTNVFAPMYRQWNLLYGTGGSMGGAPYDDIVEAFEYYYTTVNKGERPFIIYGFSQGGYLAIELASRYLGSASRIHYNDNHIITYAVGYAPTQTNINRNSRLRFSQSYNDIGVIVSWNSIAPSELSRVESANLIAPYSTLSRNGLVTNPITWTTDNRAIPASQNKRSLTGTLTPNLQSNYVGAQALTVGGGNFGILLILDLEAAGASPSSTMLGKYHTQDEDFFYESIMDNIKDRIDAFKAANGGTTSVRETSREIPGGIY